MRNKTIWGEISDNLMIHKEIFDKKAHVPKTVSEHMHYNPLLSISGLSSNLLISTISPILDFVSYQLSPKTSSVDSKFDHQNAERLGWAKANYKILKHITLRSHLLRCYTVASELTEIPDHTKAALMIAALAHDIGKDAHIKNITAIDGRHERISANFLGNLYASSHIEQQKIDLAIIESAKRIVLHHHDSDGEGVNSELKMFQHQVDYRVRQIETELVRNRMKQTSLKNSAVQ